MRIKQLPIHLANQIAAGEVIERPASVLKELLENSIDAGAKHIDLDVEKGGIKGIRITDDGCGIAREDLALALSPHATSKLYSQEDLFNIQTLGFRGEALASIGSVARLQLISCQSAEQGAWGISMTGHSSGEVVPMPHPLGTTVSVEDLFFNLPARRKFLRSEKTEFIQLEETFRRIALSHFALSLVFKHNQRLIYQLPAALDKLTQEKRIAKIFGKSFLQHAMQIEFAMTGLKLWGWLGLTSHTRSQADLQYVYLNGRMIKDKLVNHAIRQAYENKLYPGRYPLFVLYLELDPTTVDVNVHPTKHEVRFHESRLVHDFIYRNLKSVLTQHDGLPQNMTPSAERSEPYMSMPQPISQIKEPMAAYQSSSMMPLGWLHDKYWLAQHADGLLMLDVQQAVLLIHYAALLNKINAKPLLMPVVKNLSEAQVQSIEALAETFHVLGLQLASLSPKQIILRGIPANFYRLDAASLLNELCAAELAPNLSQSELIWVLAKASSHAVNVNQLEPQQLISKLEDLSAQATELNIKPMVVLNLQELAKIIAR
jgi:DNA mismatch repair protein MutL